MPPSPSSKRMRDQEDEISCDASDQSTNDSSIYLSLDSFDCDDNNANDVSRNFFS